MACSPISLVSISRILLTAGVGAATRLASALFQTFTLPFVVLLSGAIAIAVVLAVSILVLLAVLAFFFLKGQQKRAHRPVATSPPLSGEAGEGGEDDTVVYRSTTKPV